MLPIEEQKRERHTKERKGGEEEPEWYTKHHPIDSGFQDWNTKDSRIQSWIPNRTSMIVP